MEFGIKKKGRVLIGDEMGIGKTIQALALAAVYRHNWPCLIMCPATLKFNWKNEAVKWLKGLVVESQVMILEKVDQIIFKSTKIVIVSYDLAKTDAVCLKLQNNEPSFGVSIADEAHSLKSIDSVRS